MSVFRLIQQQLPARLLMVGDGPERVRWNVNVETPTCAIKLPS